MQEETGKMSENGKSGFDTSGYAAAAKVAADLLAQQRAEVKPAENGVITMFNERQNVKELLEALCEGGGNSFTSPYQQAARAADGRKTTYSIVYYDADESAVTYSGTDALHGLGSPGLGDTGSRRIDAFDLFVHFAHNCNFAAALQDARGRLIYGVKPDHHIPYMRSLEAMSAQGALIPWVQQFRYRVEYHRIKDQEIINAEIARLQSEAGA